jgi:hypothetical protein
MAKRRKEKDEEEKLDFKVPKFDEEKFLSKERRNIKTTFISFLFGILLAFICFGFWVLLQGSDLRWILVVLVGLANVSFLRYLFVRLNIDLTDFGRKGWFTSYSVYLFTWLLAFIVLVNPPFYDAEPPLVEVVALPGAQEPGGMVQIVAHITDNVGISQNGIEFSITDPQGVSSSIEGFSYQESIFLYTFENPEDQMGEFTYTLTARDVNGHTTNNEGTFTYGEDIIVLTTPQNRSEVSSLTPIEFKVQPNVYDPIPFDIQGNKEYMDFRVYYTVNNGIPINVSRLTPSDREDYRTTPKYSGWIRGANVTLKVYVEVSHYFTNVNKRFNNTIEDTTIYQFTTTDDTAIGTATRLVPPSPNYALDNKNQPENAFNYYLPFPQQQQVPGFELVVFLVSLIGVVIILKRRKKNAT